MFFKADTLIQDHRGEARWKVIKPLEQLSHIQTWMVTDQFPNMQRDLILMTLNYSKLSAHDRDFSIQRLRDSFQRMVQLLGEGTYNFYPEPIDLLTFTNNQDAMDYSLRQEEIALVISITTGKVLRPAINPDATINTHWLRTTVRSLLNILKTLHVRQVVLQELPAYQLRSNSVTVQLHLNNFHTICKMDDFQGYNPNRVALSPVPHFSAPEVLDPQGRLTPATDIYALGKLALQMTLGPAYLQYFTPDNPFPSNTQTIINALNLPEPWPRFLSMCLQLDPAQRFQNATEAEIFLMPQEKQDEIARQRSQETRQWRRAEDPNQPTSARSVHGSSQAGATAREAQTAPGQAKRPWVYHENPQLPDAMLLIWGERLTSKDQIYDYFTMYHDFLYKYNLKPRLFFQTCQYGVLSNNNYFLMLQNQYKLTVTPLDGTQNPIGVLNHTLDPYLSGLRNLILVGRADEAGVQCMLHHPNAPNWQIHWVRGAGNWNPNIPVNTVIDMAKYLRAKPLRP